MPKRTANDNIKTSHLKCDHCGTRAHLTSITPLGDGEVRSFQCEHCGKTKTLRINNNTPARSTTPRDAC
jgi:DNA-directed RNA polymerase subunit RPC12/RpoP